MQNQNRHYSDHYACAHAWANQLTDEGYSSNFFFDGNTIYSYGRHFPIAAIDGNLVFFTNKKYSRSTGRHKSRVISAVSHKEIVYVEQVPHFSPDGIRNDSFIEANIQFWMVQMTDSVRNYEANPRKRSLLEEISAARYLLIRFMTALDIEPSDKLKSVLENPSLVSILDYTMDGARKATELDKERISKRLINFNLELKEWRKGKRHHLTGSNPKDANLAYLRLDTINKCIETSKDILVPFETARQFWDFIQKVLPNGCNRCNYRIMDFEATEISLKFITIGCHKIPMGEVNKIACLLDWQVMQV